MGLNIKPSTSKERRLLFLESLLNGTDKISKISDNSVVSGIASGIAKVAGKAEKDIILAVSQLFPDSSFGDQLDQVAADHGISSRLGAIGSSTYVRIVADPGTIYLANTHIFLSSKGTRFELEADLTVGSLGFVYAKVRSSSFGEVTNVDPLTIAQVSPTPSGHIEVVNEYKATGGRDYEDDDTFRIRIKDGANILAKGTVAALEQVFMNINSKVLRVFNQGVGADGKIGLAIATQNGADLTETELNEILAKSTKYFSLTELKSFGTKNSGIFLKNIEYQYVDISFRADIDNSYNSDDIRISIQSNIAKYLDFRFFDSLSQRVEWDNLLEICKSTPGIKYIADQYFYPRVDLTIDPYKLPRVRSFLMLNLQGQVISNYSGTLSPVFYPNVVDESYHQTILNNLS